MWVTRLAFVLTARAAPPDLVFPNELMTRVQAGPFPGGGHQYTWVDQAGIAGVDPSTIGAGVPARIEGDGGGYPVGWWDLVGDGVPHLIGADDGTLWDLTDGVELLHHEDWRECFTPVRDLNGDGADDVLSEHGVWWGGPGGMTEGPRFDVSDEARWQRFGGRDQDCASVADVGDLDGDGLADLVRGSGTTEPFARLRLALYGSASRPAGREAWAPAWTLDEATSGGPNTLFSAQLDADPEPELVAVVGSCATGDDCGRAVVLWDAPTAAAAPPMTEYSNFSGGFKLLGSLGDLDGDGDDELFIGSEGLIVDSRPDFVYGRLFQVIEGDAGPTFWTPFGDQPDVLIPSGRPVENVGGLQTSAAIGDFDGNGALDFGVLAAGNDEIRGDHQLWLHDPPPAPPEDTGTPTDTAEPSTPTDPGTPPADTAVLPTADTGAPGDTGSAAPRPPRRSGCGCAPGGAPGSVVPLAVGAFLARRRTCAAR